jgi:SAM-dependent methyltransferase
MGTDGVPDPHNTYLIDSRSGAETARLILQDQLVTRGMGGLFPAHLDLSAVRGVLDLACGPAGWARGVAYQFPTIEVVGVDIDPVMTDYARAEAEVQGLGNARFQVMDLLEAWHFPAASFDLVNERFLSGVLPSAAWPTLVEECRRVLRPGGVLCLAEGDAWSISGSPALLRFSGLAVQAMFKAGLSGAPEGTSLGLSPLLPRFLRRAGFRDIRITPHVLDFSQGTEAFEGYYQNFTVASELLLPFIVKMGIASPQELEQLNERLAREMRTDDFYALWYFLVVTGRKPAEP